MLAFAPQGLALLHQEIITKSWLFWHRSRASFFSFLFRHYAPKFRFWDPLWRARGVQNGAPKPARSIQGLIFIDFWNILGTAVAGFCSFLGFNRHASDADFPRCRRSPRVYNRPSEQPFSAKRRPTSLGRPCAPRPPKTDLYRLSSIFEKLGCILDRRSMDFGRISKGVLEMFGILHWLWRRFLNFSRFFFTIRSGLIRGRKNIE